MSSIDIIFSANNGEQVMTLPIVINSLPELNQTYNNTVFSTINGELNLIGNKNLRTLRINSFFPVGKKYSKIRPNADLNGWNYVAFFNKYADSKMPIRMVILDSLGKELSNMAYSVESFSTAINLAGDIEYSLELKEYRFVKH